MSETILVVEDELVLRETLAYNLGKQGYEVHTAEEGNTGVDLAYEVQPDLILLDIMLPGIDGFEVCRLLRKEMNVPILMLTARADEVDKIVGLEVGADDYLTKPFSMRELLARIKALLRRVRMTREEVAAEVEEDEAPHQLIFDNLVIDMDRREVFLNDESLDLRPKEYDLLVCLAQNRGRVLSREQLLENVWEWDYTGGSRTVDVHIRWLREKIERDPGHPVRIITVRGVGYRFEG
ncbi:MAG: response regulator [Chloroflexi bacterium]|nr:response regulator [Chloroflexota bacterium]